MNKSIISKTNDDYKKLLDLQKGAGLKKHGQFLVMGEKIIADHRSWLKSNLLAEVRHENLAAIFPQAPQWILTKELFNDVDVLGTHFNLLLLQIPPWTEADLASEPEGLELILPLGDPANLGAVARTASALGIKTLILTAESANPMHPKAIKASAGALLSMKIQTTGALANIHGKNFWALDAAGESLMSIRFPKNLRLVLGEEGPGLGSLLSSEQIAKFVSIPIQGIESLNASVAASIAIFEYRKQFPAD